MYIYIYIHMYIYIYIHMYIYIYIWARLERRRGRALTRGHRRRRLDPWKGSLERPLPNKNTTTAATTTTTNNNNNKVRRRGEGPTLDRRAARVRGGARQPSRRLSSSSPEALRFRRLPREGGAGVRSRATNEYTWLISNWVRL